MPGIRSSGPILSPRSVSFLFIRVIIFVLVPFAISFAFSYVRSFVRSFGSYVCSTDTVGCIT